MRFTTKIPKKVIKAEIIIGKQRNGPIGTVNLSFLKEFTRFEDFAVDSYFDPFQ